MATNFRYLGFDGCEGPFESGPDFRLHKTGRWRAAEVETVATNYLKHKHHLDVRWRDVEHLIVLEDNLRSGSPQVPDVMVVDRAHFTSWCSSAMKDYALARQEERPSFVVETQLHEVGQVFRSLALETCSSKRREMAACPDCNRCPYFGDGDADGDVANRYFFQLTASFLEVAGGRVSFAAMLRFFDDHYDWSLTGFELQP